MDARPESKAVTDTIESKETTNTQPKSNDTDIIGGDEDETEDDQRLKALALQRQLEMKAKVEEARKAMNALKADDTIVDGRTLYTNVTERVFRYNYDTGQIKTSFVSREGWDEMPRRVEVFRDAYTCFDNIEMLNMLMYEANTDRRDLDDEELRLVLNKEYTEMKSDAECEIMYRCRMTAGLHVWDAKKNYVYPPGFTSWEVALDLEQLREAEGAKHKALLPALEAPTTPNKSRKNSKTPLFRRRSLIQARARADHYHATVQPPKNMSGATSPPSSRVGLIVV